MTFVREIIKEFDGTDETIKLQRELIETLEGMATAKGESSSCRFRKIS
jgi:hypothetical protein